MKQGSSSRKVNEQAREVIASILLFDISDPELSMVTITGCEVSFDRSVCNVYYSTDKQRYDKVGEAFTRAGASARSWRAVSPGALPPSCASCSIEASTRRSASPVPWRASRSVRRSS